VPKPINITHNSIELTWKDPMPCDENVERYIVSCFNMKDDFDDDDDDYDDNDNDGPNCRLFETKGNENTIIIPELFQDMNYQFSVKAQYKTELSKNSKKTTVIKIQRVVVAGPPGKPLVGNITSNSIDLKWEKPQENPDNMDGYQVLYSLAEDDTPYSDWKSQQTNGVVEQITIGGLVPKKLYYFKVQAIYNNVEGNDRCLPIITYR